MSGLIERFVEAGHTWLFECVVLFLLPFVHEDVAIFGGSLLVVEHRLPLLLAILSLYIGIVLSDFALYGLGALAHRSPWVRRALSSRGIDRLGHWLKGHVPEVVLVARLVPGLMFPLFFACGLYRVSFVAFSLASMLTVAVYLPILFFLFATFGVAILSNLGYWSWVVAILAFTAIAFSWIRHPSWQLFLRISTRGARAALHRGVVSAFAAGRVTHAGMPTLGLLPRTVARAERIPPVLFYIPLGIQWMWLALRYRDLALPALANPSIEVGGLWGESKSSYLDMVAAPQRIWLADYATLRRTRGADSTGADLERARRTMAASRLSFPLVVKPDIGWRGFGVRLIESESELRDYLSAFPEGEVVILQRAVLYDGEAGVLYVRRPGDAEGRILSLTFRYFPYAVGDGQSALRDLILRDQRTAWKAGALFGLDPSHLGNAECDLDRVPAAGEIVRLSFIGSSRVGGLYRDAREHVTPALTRRFDQISKSLPEFYYGRYDVRFESLERFRDGEAFKIIEINGAGGESINVWDPVMPLSQVYRELFHQQRLLFEFGALNRARGYKSPGAWAMFRSQWRQHRLIVRYPPSE